MESPRLKLAKDLIKKFEGFSLKAYKDTADLFTIGWGHLILPTENLKEITVEKAEELLTNDMKQAMNAVDKNVTVKLSDNQWAAMVSFVFNIGAGAFKNSTFLKLVNKGDFPAAAKAMLDWKFINKKVSKGLLSRRIQESELFAKT